MSEETISTTQTIFVYLKNEGTDVWRPTLGRRISHMVFEVMPTADYDPGYEDWEFVPGTTVECEERFLSGGKVLVAVRRVEQI